MSSFKQMHMFDKPNSPIEVTGVTTYYKAPYPQTYTVEMTVIHCRE